MVYIPVQFPDADVNEIDKLIDEKRYLNRSDAVRHLVRKGLSALKQEIQTGAGRGEIASAA